MSRNSQALLLLAGIRLFNGATALLVPELLLRRMGLNPRTNGAAVYFMRMFGIRTVFLAAELLLRPGPVRDHTMRTAVFIHGSDALSALLVALNHQLPKRVAITTVVISTLNATLALRIRSVAHERKELTAA